MKRRVIFLCAAVVLMWSATCGAARLEVSTGEPVEIRIAVGVPTVVTFPEKIKGIPTNANPEYVSMEASGTRLFVVSREEGFGGRVFVIGESDRLHILELVQAEPADTEVQLVLPQAPPRPGGGGEEPKGPPCHGKRPNAMRRLLIAMIKGERLPGVEVLEHEQVLAASDAVEIRTTRVYAAGRYLGFLGTARNLTAEPFVLRLPEYQAQGLKAVAADDETIAAGAETRVYLVFEPGSPY
ncbi:MAG: type-F conjugative transfer system secretin TraK [Candidatus Tectomicrobia bacterium]|nr:type-F conjugative transfer system secretin TraK [Candidatus Tectomicrobia bacterium]